MKDFKLEFLSSGSIRGRQIILDYFDKMKQLKGGKMILDDAILALLTQKVWSENQITALQELSYEDIDIEEKVNGDIKRLRGRIESYSTAIDILSKHAKKSL